MPLPQLELDPELTLVNLVFQGDCGARGFRNPMPAIIDWRKYASNIIVSVCGTEREILVAALSCLFDRFAGERRFSDYRAAEGY